jgi:Skp family chaperone for outer membrane proteins
MPVRCAIAAAIVLPLFLTQPKTVAAAEKMAAPVIMVIDVQKIINEAKSTRAILGQREKFEQSYRQEFQAEEGRLAEEKKQLDDQRTVLSPEAFAEKQKAFGAKAADYTRRAQIRFANLNEATNNAMGQVATHLSKILREMSGEMGVNLVLNRSQVEYYDPSMDKTQIAADRLNSTMKEVTFLDPVKMGEAQAKARAEAAKAAKDKDAKKK